MDIDGDDFDANFSMLMASDGFKLTQQSKTNQTKPANTTNTTKPANSTSNATQITTP